MFIIIPCFISMIRNGFGFGSTLGFVIGALLFLHYYVDFYVNIWGLIVPAILVYIGLRLIFRRNHFRFDKNVNMDSQQSQPGGNFTSANKTEYNAIFAGNHVRLTNEQFTGTNLNAVFGSIVLDLRDAIIQNDVEISANAIFAGIDIYVPRGVRVKINNVPIFGGVSNKADQNAAAGAPTIYLNSTCMFGGIDIK
jgi:predicted membrane protein